MPSKFCNKSCRHIFFYIRIFINGCAAVDSSPVDADVLNTARQKAAVAMDRSKIGRVPALLAAAAAAGMRSELLQKLFQNQVRSC